MVITGAIVGVLKEFSFQVSGLPLIERAIFGVAAVLLISSIFAFIARILRQPLIPAYVIAGLITGPLVFGLIQSKELIYAFGEIGIVFLLFAAGLEISFRKIREANLRKILVVGIFQVLAIFLIVFFSKNLFGISQIQAVYLGIILAFSSTMVDVKLLSDRGELVTLHGRLVLGILLLQDLVAIIAIALLTAGNFSVGIVLMTFFKLALILGVAVFMQKYVLERVFRYAARSTELLFISSLGVLFLFIILSYMWHLSIAIGAFIAGISLANSPFKTELESRISPIKDFFAILFFIALGMQIVFNGIDKHFGLLAFLVLAGLLIKPIIIYVLLRVGAYQQKTSFQTSISMAQLSEFSLIIGIIGFNAGVLTESLLSTVILATVITMSFTPYLIEKKDFIYKYVSYFLGRKERFPSKDLSYSDKNKKTILLIGAHRTGSVILNELIKKNKKHEIIVLDHNPEIISALTRKKISSIYGTITSPDVLDKLNLEDFKLVISTIPYYDDNLHLLRKVKKANPKTEVVVTAGRISETMDLYMLGADYVITPKVIAGEKMASIMHSNKKIFKKEKTKHLEFLKEIHKLLY
jgi:Kef-type K+ transport system membrane component KefB